MSNLLTVGINVIPSRSTPDFLRNITDDGHFADDLGRHGLHAVITSKRSFQTGDVQELHWTPNGVEFVAATVDPTKIVAVRNHVIPPSKAGYLADIPTLNSDLVKEFVESNEMSGVDPEDAIKPLPIPEGVHAATPGDVAKLDALRTRPDNPAVLRGYVVRNSGVTLVRPVLRTQLGKFFDVALDDELADKVDEIAVSVAEEISRATGVGHILGAVSLGATKEGDVRLTGLHFHSPELPTTKEAPDAARAIFPAIAETLASMSR